jgi:ATP-binding cassette subfamily F protein 2
LRLETEAETLMKLSGDMESERLQDIYERLDELDAATAETKAARLLHGLGIYT